MNYPAQQYAAPYVPTYAPQHAMMPYTGQLPVPVGTAAGPVAPPGTEKPGITTKAWWQETTAGFPRWSLAAGAVTLGLIGYGWNAGWFDAGSGRRSTSSSRRDPGRRKRRSGGKRRGRRSGRSTAGRFNFDF